MKHTDKRPIEEREVRMGEDMDTMTFGELVRELTGTSFDAVFKGFRNYGDNEDEKSYME